MMLKNCPQNFVTRGLIRRPLRRSGLEHRACGREYGITFVELLIVVVVVAVMAAAIMPRVAAFEASRQLEADEASIIRLPGEAKVQAAKAQLPVRLRIDGNAFVMEQIPIENGTYGDPQMIQQLQIPQDVTVGTMELNGQTVNSGDWIWLAYPDGASDEAAIEFNEGSVQKSLIMPANSNSRWIAGPIPDEGQQKWSAGQLAVRTTT